MTALIFCLSLLGATNEPFDAWATETHESAPLPESTGVRLGAGELKNLAEARPEKLAEMIEIARQARTPSKEFPSPFDE
jgi:hypothetical protein